jgi:hypothetical protein
MLFMARYEVTCCFSFLLLLATAVGQDQPQEAKGTIYGIVVRRDGQRVPGIGLTATPLGVALAAVLPHTKANAQGGYRFENIPWWGRYTVYADDEEAGFSTFSTGPSGEANPPQVEITPDRPQAELNVQLPPRAGFLEIHLTDSQTGSLIPDLQIEVMSVKNPDQLVFSESCSSTHAILVPPEKPLLLHVASPRYREWNESRELGKLIFLKSGDRLKLDVRLQPSD